MTLLFFKTKLTAGKNVLKIYGTRSIYSFLEHSVSAIRALKENDITLYVTMF